MKGSVDRRNKKGWEFGAMVESVDKVHDFDWAWNETHRITEFLWNYQSIIFIQ